MTEEPQRAEVWTIVVAGGAGHRFGGGKQYVTIAGRRVLDWSVRAASAVSQGVVVVVPAADVDNPVEDAALVVSGGSSRSDSVRRGLAVVPMSAEVILVHDAARPAAGEALFQRVVDAVIAGADGVVPAVAVSDSLRRVDGGGVDRSRFVAVQTPQGFPAARLRHAYESTGEASDDATLVETDGGSISVVDGDIANIKLTHPHDLVVLEHTLAGTRPVDADGSRR